MSQVSDQEWELLHIADGPVGLKQQGAFKIGCVQYIVAGCTAPSVVLGLSV